MRYLRIATLILFSLSLTCCSRFWSEETKTEDGLARQWINYSLDNPGEWQELDTAFWKPVANSELNKAIGLLGTSSFVPLSREQSAEFTGLQFTPVTSENNPFLVRVVAAASINTHFEVLTRPGSDDIWVGGAIRSYFTEPLKRSALVVWRKQKPARINITFDMAR